MDNKKPRVLRKIIWLSIWIGLCIGHIELLNNDFEEMQRWPSVEATLLQGGVKTLSVEKSDKIKYQAFAEYRYLYNGKTYIGKKIFAYNNSATPDLQKEIGDALKVSLAENESITIYISPRFPDRSVIDRSVKPNHYNAINFLLCLFAFIVIVSFLKIAINKQKHSLIEESIAKSEKSTINDFEIFDKAVIEDIDLPRNIRGWRNTNNWESNLIRSNSFGNHIGITVFAVVWSVITGLLIFSSVDDIKNNGAPGETIYFFSFVAILSAGISAFRYYTRRRFGDLIFVMQTYPGIVGGSIAGYVDTQLPFSESPRCKAILRCELVTRVEDVDGRKGKPTRETYWKKAVATKSRRTMDGTRFEFLIETESHLPSASLKRDKEYYRWELTIANDFHGFDINQRFDIPVFRLKSSDIIDQRQSNNFTVRQSQIISVEPDEFIHEVPSNVLDVSKVNDGIELRTTGMELIALKAFGIFIGFIGVCVSLFKLISSDNIYVPLLFLLLAIGIFSFSLASFSIKRSVFIKKDEVTINYWFKKYLTRSKLIIIEGDKKMYIKKSLISRKRGHLYNITLHSKMGQEIKIVKYLSSFKLAREIIINISDVTGIEIEEDVFTETP